MFRLKKTIPSLVIAAAACLVSSSPASATPTSYTDSSLSDFNAGAVSGTVQTNNAGGEVALAPGSTDFPGSSLPSDWQSTSYGGSASVSGGVVTLNGASAGSNTSFGSGHSLTFTGTFTGDTYQDAGLGKDYLTDPAVMFYTGSGSALYAYADGTVVTLSSSFLNHSNAYRIDWNGESAQFYVNSSLVATIPITDNRNMRPLFVDTNPGAGGDLLVSKVRVTSFNPVAPTFTSAPTHWTTTPWATGGTASASSGVLTINGARSGSDVAFAPGHSIQFTGIFTGAANQHGGFGQSYVTADPGLTFSTQAGGALYAYGAGTTVALSSSYLNTSHVYKVNWLLDHVVYYVDGTQVADIATAQSDNMRPLFSDYIVGGAALKISNLSVSATPALNATSFASMPSDFTTTPWASGGGSSVVSGNLAADGARAGSDATIHSGSTLNFNAKFTGAEYQHGGLAYTYDGSYPAMAFSTYTGGAFYAVADGNYVALSNSYLGGFHDYKIVWNGNDVVFFVDSVQVADIAVTELWNLRPLFSDLDVGGDVLTVASASVTPITGVFTSRVINSTAVNSWDTAAWNVTTPTGTAVSISVRAGNAAVPNGTWSAWTPISASGGSIGLTGQYIQYQATFSNTTNIDNSPVLKDITLTTL